MTARSAPTLADCHGLRTRTAEVVAVAKPRISGTHRMPATLDGGEVRTRSPCHHGLVRIPAEQVAAGSVERCPRCSALWDVELLGVMGNEQELTTIWSA